MTTATLPKFPDALWSHETALVDALAKPLLVTWDDELDYHIADQPEAIGAALVKCDWHLHLRNAAMGYLYKKDMKTRGAEIWGRASRVTGKVAFYSELDFLIEINWSAWARLSPARRVALMDHELSHCGREETEDGRDKWVMLPHDVEEFQAIARRWGAWRPAVAHFANAIAEGEQLGLFPHD